MTFWTHFFTSVSASFAFSPFITNKTPSLSIPPSIENPSVTLLFGQSSLTVWKPLSVSHFLNGSLSKKFWTSTNSNFRNANRQRWIERNCPRTGDARKYGHTRWHRARKIAEQLGVNYTGTIGVIIRAKIIGVIPAIKPILLKIKETDFRLSVEIERQPLLAAGEV